MLSRPTNFGRYIKVGVIEDRDNKDALLKLAAFSSSAGSEDATLPDYISRMKEGQKQIYYLSGASKAAASASPVLERLQIAPVSWQAELSLLLPDVAQHCILEDHDFHEQGQGELFAT